MPSVRRIRPQSRPLRPPLTKSYRATRARFFARNPQLLLVTHATTRPQLTFLTPLRSAAQPTLVSRLISTETKRFIKEQSQLAGKYTIIGAIVCSAGLAWAWMLTQEMVDRDFPAPKEWTFLTKVVYHAARGLEVPAANERGVVNWGVCGLAYRDLLKRLENRELDGKGLRVQDEADVIIPGMGHTGFDIEGMSYEWRTGYYHALMGCGRAAIELEDSVVDSTRNLMFRRDHMIGPSIKKPRKLPPKAPAAPLEENCGPAYAPPETYYLKILTTKGFTTKQKTDAALAYGSWLDFKGLYDTAEEMYQWALDLASSGVEDESKVLDKNRGIVKPDAPVTSNILDAATALAVHRAQSGDTSTALPMFLSILRARRDAPPGDLVPRNAGQQAQSRATRIKRTDIEALQSQIQSFWSLMQAAKFPAPGPTGNEVYLRTPEASCDEAAVMAYIGEILFASGLSQRDAGLSWTKSALELAYTSYMDPRTSRACKIKSVDCLLVATTNRRKMIELQRSRVAGLVEERAHASFWRKWVPGLLVAEDTLKKEQVRWEKEFHELVDFDLVLNRGRVYDIDEEPAPLWGSKLLMEWIIPRFSKTEWQA